MVANLSRLIGCNVYISEGRNVQLIRHLENLCKGKRYVGLANTFIDEPYNRTGLTLVATCLLELTNTVAAVAQQAVASIDLRDHVADHPRLGVVDHVSLHPLGPEATLQQAAAAARNIGEQLASPPTQLPVYYYGSAHATGRELAEVRRRLGYFKSGISTKPLSMHQRIHDLPIDTTTSSSFLSSSSSEPSSSSNGRSSSCQGDWAGGLDVQYFASFPPDAGPLAAPPAAGIVTVGAVPWVVNYNVPLCTDDMSAARAVARAVSTRGGGPPGVQAMALRHGSHVIEIATNLIRMDWSTCQPSVPQTQSESSNRTGAVGPQLQHQAGSSSVAGAQSASSGVQEPVGAGPEEVQAAVAAAASKYGLLPPGSGYITNKMPWQLVEFAGEALRRTEHR